MRDLDKNPYSADEKRVAEWLCRLGLGGGDDPIGFLLASHSYINAQRLHMKDTLEEYRQERNLWSKGYRDT